MIDPQLFDKEYRALCERFNRKWDIEGATRYYDEISPRIDDERFVDSCRKIYYEFSRFPSPSDFVTAAPKLDSILPSGMPDPYAPVYIDILRGSVEHERIKHRDQRWEVGKDYWIDSRGMRCTIRSYNFQNDEGHGFPIPCVRIV